MEIDGIVNVNKGPGITSFCVVNRIRKITGASKAGHAGTLDPMATGVLPVCLGKATKASEAFLSMPKRYRGEITFGLETSTCDIWGDVINEDGKVSLTAKQIEEAVASFKGDIFQVPPQVSAIKVNGVPAYKLARKGTDVALEKRPVTIYSISMVSCDISLDRPKAVIDVLCSRGTYIRSLARDIGSKLGYLACMSALKRLSYGKLDISEAVSIEDIETMLSNKDYSFLRSIDSVYSDLPYYLLSKKQADDFLHGRKCVIPIDKIEEAYKMDEKNRYIRLYIAGNMIAIAAMTYISEHEAELKAYKNYVANKEV